MSFRVDGDQSSGLSPLPWMPAPDPNHHPDLVSVDRLFALMMRTMRGDSPRVSVRFEPVFGYPQSGQIDPDAMATDDETLFTIIDFKVIEK